MDSLGFTEFEIDSFDRKTDRYTSKMETRHWPEMTRKPLPDRKVTLHHCCGISWVNCGNQKGANSPGDTQLQTSTKTWRTQF